jgi:hypothetical protein
MFKSIKKYNTLKTKYNINEFFMYHTTIPNKKNTQSNLHCHQLDLFYEEDAIQSVEARRTFSEKLS